MLSLGPVERENDHHLWLAALGILKSNVSHKHPIQSGCHAKKLDESTQANVASHLGVCSELFTNPSVAGKSANQECLEKPD